MLSFFIIFLAGLLLFFIFIFVRALPAMIHVAPIPTQKEAINKILDLAEIKKGERFYDLGCGDGRVLVAAAKKYDCQSIGYELVLPVAAIAWLRAMFSGKNGQIKIVYDDLFNADLSDADIIFCYLIPSLMGEMEKFLKSFKLKKKARIISYGFVLKSFKPVRKVESLGYGKNWNIYLYKP